MRRSLQLMAIGALALPLAAHAQTQAQIQAQTQTVATATDRDYCHRLGAIYEHFLGRSNASPYDDYRRGPLSAQVATAQCDGANVAGAIAVLEDQLKRNGFTLPPRG